MNITKGYASCNRTGWKAKQNKWTLEIKIETKLCTKYSKMQQAVKIVLGMWLSVNFWRKGVDYAVLFVFLHAFDPHIVDQNILNIFFPNNTMP